PSCQLPPVEAMVNLSSARAVRRPPSSSADTEAATIPALLIRSRRDMVMLQCPQFEAALPPRHFSCGGWPRTTGTFDDLTVGPPVTLGISVAVDAGRGKRLVIMVS